MTEDARFEDGSAAPVNLVAFDADDLKVISALVQDAVLPIAEMRWQRGQRRLALLINRLRREDLTGPQRGARQVERVQALLVLEQVEAVASQGIDRDDTDTVLQILSLDFEPGTPPEGHVTITLAGDGALRARVEALEVRLRDVTRPYLAPSGRVPRHDD